MATKKLQILDYNIKQAENADTVDGKHAADFATTADMTTAQSDIADLQTKVGDTSVSEQITAAIANKSDVGHTHSEYVNQNAFSNVKVGTMTIAADSATDTLTLAAGDNITLTPDATNDKVTIAAKDTVYTHPSYTARTGVPTANATPAFGGTFNISQPVSDATGHITAINSRTVTIPSTVATTSASGLMSPTDKTKLEGIESGANKTIVDSAFSSTSTNPVQNKVINSAISNLNTLVGDASVSSQISTAINAIDYPVDSVNGKTGAVTLTAADVGALPDSTAIPSIDGLATETYVNTKVAGIVNSAPETLDTLNELAAALGNDPNFVTTVATQIGTKVDKIDGKGLSTNDYTTTEKNKLAGIAEGANKTTVDSTLSSTSTNPVQNKVVNAAIDNLTSIVGDTPIPTQVENAIDTMAVQVDLDGAPEGTAETNNADTLGGKSLSDIESEISNAAALSTSRTWTVTVRYSGWVEDSLTFMGIECTYKNVVSVAGMTSDVAIDLVRYVSGSASAARSYICQDTGDGTVTFWAKAALATFAVKLTEVK